MKRFTVGILMLFASVALAVAQSELQVLAVVKLDKSESITLKELRSRVETYERQTNKTFDVSQKKEILEAIIDEKLIVQAATKAGISLTDSQVDQYFMQNMSQQIGRQLTEKELADLIRQQENMSLDEYMKKQVGMNLSEYKSYLKCQLIAQRYVIDQKRDELQNVSPSDADIRSFYEMNKASFVQNDMLKMFLVMVPKNKDAAGAKTKAQGLLDDYKNKKQTLDQLRVKSRVDNSGFQAGDLLISKTQQHARQLGLSYNDLMELFSKDKGYVSSLTETDNDFQFYTILDKYGAKMLEISDVVQPGTTVTVYEYIKQNLTQQKQNQFLIQAIQDISKALNTDSNVSRRKTGDSLDKLLNWDGTK
jgi:hypothetical protein